jgi:hypothetical protein
LTAIVVGLNWWFRRFSATDGKAAWQLRPEGQRCEAELALLGASRPDDRGSSFKTKMRVVVYSHSSTPAKALALLSR